MAANEPEWLTPQEVATLFRVNEDTVQRWAKRWEQDKTVKVIRTPSGRIRFRHDDIRKLQGQK